MANRRSAHIRVSVHDDYDSVKYRAGNINSRGYVLPRARQEDRGLTRFNPNTSWAMAQDDLEYALDENGGLYNERLDQDIFYLDSEPVPVVKKKRVKRSVASVSGLLIFLLFI